MNIKDKIKKICQEEFAYVFFCERVWSAWSYDTMTIDDFIPIFDDEELLDEFVNLVQVTKHLSFGDIEIFFEKIEAYYNSDIDYSFDKEYFAEDWIAYIELEDFFEQIKAIKYTEKIIKF